MKNLIEIKVGISDVKDANLFLRAFWSEIREKFGDCSWFYTPLVKKQKKEIHLGQFTTKDESLGTIEVIITYANKGGIDKIILISKNHDISKMVQPLNLVFSSYKNKLSKQRISTSIDLSPPISKYENEHFAIKPINSFQTELQIDVMGYDEKDLHFISLKKFNQIIDLLAGAIWKSVFFTSQKENVNPAYENIDVNIPSEKITFEFNDDRLEKNGFIYLPTKVMEIIKTISNNSELSRETKSLLRACRLFHAALKLEQMMGTVIQKRMDFYETLITNYMSTLEVLSFSDEPVKQCGTCGQNLYSISKRVKQLIMTVFKGDDVRIKMLYSIYSDRSKYLHTGKYFSSKNYSGITIPQLSSSDTLVEHQLFYDDGRVKFNVGACIEFYINGLTLPD